MATVKVKFRKSTVNGKARVIYYQLCYKQKIAQFTTGIRLLTNQWDTDKAAVITSGSELQSDLQIYQQWIGKGLYLCKPSYLIVPLQWRCFMQEQNQ